MPKSYSVWDTFLAETKEEAVAQAITKVVKTRGVVTFDPDLTKVVGPFTPQMRHFEPPYPVTWGGGAFDVQLTWTEGE